MGLGLKLGSSANPWHHFSHIISSIFLGAIQKLSEEATDMIAYLLIPSPLNVDIP